MRSDFIFAPHLRFVCGRASKEIIDQLKADLKSGIFSPSVPITMEVPKSYCMRVVVPSRRGGPPFSRPGSILLPRDRLFYQALADEAAPIIELKTDKARSFSHRLAESDSANMFQPTRTCWSNLQKALAKQAKSKSSQYILKIDVANFFGSLNQHTMINILNDAGYSPKQDRTMQWLMFWTPLKRDRQCRKFMRHISPNSWKTKMLRASLRNYSLIHL